MDGPSSAPYLTARTTLLRRGRRWFHGTIGRLACALAVLMLAGALVSGAIAGAEPTAAARVSGAWVRLAAVAGRPAAGYLTLRGGAVGDRLIGITSPRAGRIEMHSSMAMQGMMHMDKLEPMSRCPQAVRSRSRRAAIT